MSLTVSSKGPAYGLASALLSTAAPAAEAPIRPRADASWSWAPPAVASGRDARAAKLIATLSQFSAPGAGAFSRTDTGRARAETMRGTLSSVADPSDPLPSLPSPSEDGIPASPTPVALTTDDATADPRAAVLALESEVPSETADPIGTGSSTDPATSAEIKLDALFKTLQAYGL